MGEPRQARGQLTMQSSGMRLLGIVNRKLRLALSASHTTENILITFLGVTSSATATKFILGWQLCVGGIVVQHMKYLL